MAALILLSLLFNPFIMPHRLVEFSESSATSWQVVNDGVMGGLSRGRFEVIDDGIAVFSGHVSLANNGGFSLVQHRLAPTSLSEHQRFVIRLRGDGKRYQFRVRAQGNDRHTYVAYFTTSGKWELIEIPFSELYPNFRGRRLEMPGFSGQMLSEIGFLAGNKREEDFRLELDWVEAR